VGVTIMRYINLHFTYLLTQLPHPERGTAAPDFSAKVHCGQTAGWIKMPLGTQVGLGLGDVVLDGDSAPPKTA